MWIKLMKIVADFAWLSDKIVLTNWRGVPYRELAQTEESKPE